MAKVKKVEREVCDMPYGYKVNIERYCDHSEQEAVEWGSWSASYTNTIDGLIIKETEHPDVASIYDLKPGERAFIVWVEWSSGDSFGRGIREYTEVIGLFTKYEDAEVLKEKLESELTYDDSSYGVDKVVYWIKTPDGQIFQTGFAPWRGYFETLESVHIDRVEVR